MRLRKIGDVLLATYGVVTAVDKLNSLMQEEQKHKEKKRIKRDMRKNKLYRDYERLMFDSKDAAFDFLDKMRDTIDRKGYITCADVYDMYGKVPTYDETKIGWHIIFDDSVKIKKENGFWKLSLPRPFYLEGRDPK